MKYKLAILFSFLAWFIIYTLSLLFKPYYIGDLEYINIFIPISTIIVTVFFGILYIREISENEVLEGFYFGICLFAFDVILDFIYTIINGSSTPINFSLSHVISMLILFPLITVLLGYLAQMKIDLR